MLLLLKLLLKFDIIEIKFKVYSGNPLTLPIVFSYKASLGEVMFEERDKKYFQTKYHLNLVLAIKVKSRDRRDQNFLDEIETETFVGPSLYEIEIETETLKSS